MTPTLYTLLQVLGLPINDTLFRIMLGVMLSGAGSVLSRSVGFNVPLAIWRF